MQVNWEITNNCNYRCSYCFNRNKKKDFVLTNEVIDRVLDNIFELDNEFSITLTGGEPTLSPFLKLVVNKIFEYNKKKINIQNVNFITNGSQDFQYYKEFEKYPKKRFFIRLSIHPRYWSIRLQKLLLNMYKAQIPLKISVIYDKKYIDRVIESVLWINQFPRSKLFSPSLRKVFGFDEEQRYNDIDLNFHRVVNKIWGYNNTSLSNNKYLNFKY